MFSFFILFFKLLRCLVSCSRLPSFISTDLLCIVFSLPAVVVGADRVVANGDTANKVGTYQLAIAAKHHGIPFYVAAPSTSCDLSLESGRDIIIEVRPSEELTSINGVPIAAPGKTYLGFVQRGEGFRSPAVLVSEIKRLHIEATLLIYYLTLFTKTFDVLGDFLYWFVRKFTMHEV